MNCFRILLRFSFLLKEKNLWSLYLLLLFSSQRENEIDRKLRSEQNTKECNYCDDPKGNERKNVKILNAPVSEDFTKANF